MRQEKNIQKSQIKMIRKLISKHVKNISHSEKMKKKKQKKTKQKKTQRKQQQKNVRNKQNNRITKSLW